MYNLTVQLATNAMCCVAVYRMELLRIMQILNSSFLYILSTYLYYITHFIISLAQTLGS